MKLSLRVKQDHYGIRSQAFTVCCAAFTSLYIFGWSTHWTFDSATSSLFLQNSYFTEQARSILAGHLWIDPQAHPWECFFVDKKCYGYFGIAPSVIRIPFLFLGGNEVFENAALFISLASGIASWAGIDLCSRVIKSAGFQQQSWVPLAMMCAAILIGPAGLLMLLIDPYVYQESIAWSVAGTMIAVNLFWRWWHFRSDHLLLLATFAMVIASGARPTSAFVGTAMAIGCWCYLRTESSLPLRTHVVLTMLAVLPVITTFAVMFLKFGSLLPPYETYQSRQALDFQQVLVMNPELTNGFRNLPTTLFAYLRPDSIRLESTKPFVGFRFGNPHWRSEFNRITYLPPLPPDSLYVERVASLTSLIPLSCCLVARTMWVVCRKNQHKIEKVLLLAVLIPPTLMMMTFGVALRYLVDFFPLVTLGVALSLRSIRFVSVFEQSKRKIITIFFGLFLLWQVLVLPSLAMQDSRIYLFGIK